MCSLLKKRRASSGNCVFNIFGGRESTCVRRKAEVSHENNSIDCPVRNALYGLGNVFGFGGSSNIDKDEEKDEREEEKEDEGEEYDEDGVVIKRHSDGLDYCYLPLTCDRERIIEEIMCTLCGNCMYHPKLLSCGHTFCECCISDHLLSSPCCPTCNMPIESVCCNITAEEKVAMVFPSFPGLRQVLNYALEKRMYLELLTLKNRLGGLRDVVLQLRQIKSGAFMELKEDFIRFFEIHNEVQQIEKVYKEELRKFEEEIKVRTFIAAGTGSTVDGLPTNKCCLEYMIASMENNLVKSPEELELSYGHTLMGVDFSKPMILECPACGSPVNLLPAIYPLNNVNSGCPTSSTMDYVSTTSEAFL